MPPFETSFLILLIVAGLAYLLGSVPFGLVVAKAMGLPDPRTIGSKNIGATNVLRTGSKKAALATVLLDGAKGLVSVLLARAVVGEDAAQVAALGAFLGHCFSLFLNFKGGKGVATFIGALFGLSFVLGCVAAVLWLGTLAIGRYSSLSALVAASFVPVVALATGRAGMFVVLAVMAGLLIWRHRENIARLQAGTESKVGSKGA
ncbi:MAG: glycerol-3-phosphate 1-O-acyltransferase PlsY [Silicimonas sp.]|jgi:glycerol-3-phosphate acyltransferase PlsY|nr:glycerol-3-phosphate 1-O-acyltransferase PlsY [Silicimonas sp.]